MSQSHAHPRQVEQPKPAQLPTSHSPLGSSALGRSLGCSTDGGPAHAPLENLTNAKLTQTARRASGAAGVTQFAFKRKSGPVQGAPGVAVPNELGLSGLTPAQLPKSTAARLSAPTQSTSAVRPAEPEEELSFSSEWDTRSRTASQNASSPVFPHADLRSVNDSPSPSHKSPKLAPLTFDLPDLPASSNSSRRSSARIVSPTTLSFEPLHVAPSPVSPPSGADKIAPAPAVPFPSQTERRTSEDLFNIPLFLHELATHAERAEAAQVAEEDILRLRSQQLIPDFADFDTPQLAPEANSNGFPRSFSKSAQLSILTGSDGLGKLVPSESNVSLLGPVTSRSRQTSMTTNSGDMMAFTPERMSFPADSPFRATPGSARTTRNDDDAIDALPETPSRTRKESKAALAISPKSMQDKSFDSEFGSSAIASSSEEEYEELDLKEHPFSHLLHGKDARPSLAPMYEHAAMVLCPPVRLLPSLEPLMANVNTSQFNSHSTNPGFEMLRGAKGTAPLTERTPVDPEVAYLELFISFHIFKAVNDGYRSVGETKTGHHFRLDRNGTQMSIDWVARPKSATAGPSSVPVLPELAALAPLDESAPAEAPPAPVPVVHRVMPTRDNLLQTRTLVPASPPPAPAPAKPKPRFSAVKWLKRGGTASSSSESLTKTDGLGSNTRKQPVQRIRYYELEDALVTDAYLPDPFKAADPSRTRSPRSRSRQPSKHPYPRIKHQQPAYVPRQVDSPDPVRMSVSDDSHSHGHSHLVERRKRRNSVTSMRSVKSFTPGGGRSNHSGYRDFLSDVAFLATPPIAYGKLTEILAATFQTICQHTDEFDDVIARYRDSESDLIRELNHIVEITWIQLSTALLEMDGGETIVHEERHNLLLLLENVTLGLLWDELYTKSYLTGFSRENVTLNHIISLYQKRALIPADFDPKLARFGSGESLAGVVRLLKFLSPGGVSASVVSDEIVKTVIDQISADFTDDVRHEFATEVRQTLADTRSPLSVQWLIRNAFEELGAVANQTQPLSAEGFVVLMAWAIGQSGIQDMHSLVRYASAFVLSDREPGLDWCTQQFQISLGFLLEDPLGLIRTSPLPRAPLSDYVDSSSTARSTTDLTTSFSHPASPARDRRQSWQGHKAAPSIGTSGLSVEGDLGASWHVHSRARVDRTSEEMPPPGRIPPSSSGSLSRNVRKQSLVPGSRLQDTIPERRRPKFSLDEPKARPLSMSVSDFGQQPRIFLNSSLNRSVYELPTYANAPMEQSQIRPRSAHGELTRSLSMYPSPKKPTTGLHASPSSTDMTRAHSDGAGSADAPAGWSGIIRRNSSAGSLFGFSVSPAGEGSDRAQSPQADTDHALSQSSINHLRSAGQVRPQSGQGTWLEWGRERLKSFGPVTAPFVAAAAPSTDGSTVPRRSSFSAGDSLRPTRPTLTSSLSMMMGYPNPESSAKLDAVLGRTAAASSLSRGSTQSSIGSKHLLSGRTTPRQASALAPALDRSSAISAIASTDSVADYFDRAQRDSSPPTSSSADATPAPHASEAKPNFAAFDFSQRAERSPDAAAEDTSPRSPAIGLPEGEELQPPVLPLQRCESNPV